MILLLNQPWALKSGTRAKNFEQANQGWGGGCYLPELTTRMRSLGLIDPTELGTMTAKLWVFKHRCIGMAQERQPGTIERSGKRIS